MNYLPDQEKKSMTVLCTIESEFLLLAVPALAI
jgi:hypothetical protein